MNKIKTIVLAPSKSDKGGIASVVKIHKKYKPELILIATTLGSGSFIKKFYILFSAFFLFCYQLCFRKIDIVYIHSASYDSFNRKYHFFKIAKLFKKKLIFQIHGGKFNIFFKNSSPKQKRKITYVLEKSDAIICLSKEWESYYKKNFKLKNVFILNNVVDYPQKVNKKLIFPLQFLFLGLIGKNKGIWDLCEVIAKNKNILKDKLKLKIGGNGETEDLLKYIKEKKIQELVEYIGWVDNLKKIEYLNSSDVYVLPSYNEGLPISILEAMSYGMPIISTNVGGIPNVVGVKNGFLIEPGDKEALFYSINYFITNSDQIEKMGKKSIELVNEFLPDRVIEDLNNIYDTILC